MDSVDVTLTNGLILCDPADPRVVRHACTDIGAGRLLRVNYDTPAEPQGKQVLDCTGCLIMPGLINAHAHGAMSLLRGLADDLPLDRWLNDYIFPAEARYANPEFVHLGTLLSAAEMLLNGVTTVADAYFHMEHAAHAFARAGLRAIVAQGILDIPSPDAPNPGSWESRVERFLADFPSDSLCGPALFCHSPYLCGPDTLQRASAIASDRDLILFCHVAESAWEVADIRERYGCRPVEHLQSIGVLNDRFVAVHGVHVSEPELDMLAASGTSVIHCPESNMKLSSGMAPIHRAVEKGVPVGLGTDGAASNNNLDMIEEMRTAALLAKVATNEPHALDARTVLEMATTGNARAIGLEKEIGNLREGKRADMAILDMEQPHLIPLYDSVSHLVYAARGSDVRDVFVGGRRVVANRRITTIDETALRQEVRLFSRRIAHSTGRTGAWEKEESHE